MASVVNDENQSPCPEAKHIDSVLDIFALDQPTGRPSILRQSENLPSKTVAKGVKVCFQTPRRDPFTKRIVSPSKTGKRTTLEECTKALESLQLHNSSTLPQDVTAPVDRPKIELSPNLDDMPIQSKGGYNFDLDNLDAMNPFQASIKVPNSPTKPALEDVPASTKVPQCGIPENVSREISQTEMVLDDTLPITSSMENSLANMSTDIHSTDSSVVIVSKRRADEEQHSSSNISDEETPAAMTSTVIPGEATANYSVEDAPLPPKGSYNLDFDNLDSVDPFMTGGSKMQNSPQVGKKVPCSDPPDMESVNKVEVPAKLMATVVSDTPKLTEDDFMSQPTGAPLKVLESINSVDVPEKLVATAVSDALKPTKDESVSQTADAPLPPKGSYNLDFDNLDSVNPFMMGGSKMQNSPQGGKKVPCRDPPDMESVNKVDVPAKLVATVVSDTPKLTEDDFMSQPTGAPLKVLESRNSVDVPEKLVATAVSDALKPTKDESVSQTADAPLPPKGSYNLDFDNLDSVNPFMMGGSKMQNSPQGGKKVPCRDPPDMESVNKVDVPAKLVATVVSNTPKLTEDDFMSQPTGAPLMVLESRNSVDVPEKLVATAVSDTLKPTKDESVSQTADDPLNEGPVKLEFNFDDGVAVKRKPPPKRFSKKPPGLKSTERKPAHEKKEPTPPKTSPVKPVADDVNMAPIPKSSYSFQLDKFDDPNFNPFGTNAKMNNSATSGEKSNPVDILAKAPTPVKEIPTPACTGDEIDDIHKIGPTPVSLTEDNVTTDEKETVPGPDLGFQPEIVHSVQPVFSNPEFITLGHFDQNSQTGLLEPTEEFVPGTMFMANDFDGQMDYLEQCGTGSFKESALRKQSLYLKFDPLLKESPKKAVGPGAQNPIPRLAPFVSRLEAPQIADTKAVQSRDDFKLVDVIESDSELHVCRVAPLPQPTNAEDAIVEMLKYSQKDMDQAIALVQTVANEKDKQWKAKYDKLFEESEDKKRIISELESSSAKMKSAQESDRQKMETSLREALRQALLEKEQVQTELSNLERSFSEVLRRLDKYKEVILGCRKNEEILKACAQDALARIKKEEQRYQTLKAHAEEKIEMANKQIFEVRSKFKAEMVGLQAQLRMEQLKVLSLEKSLDQKGKEFVELSKVCDELITNVQRS